MKHWVKATDGLEIQISYCLEILVKYWSASALWTWMCHQHEECVELTVWVSSYCNTIPECCVLDQEVTSPLKLVAEFPLSSGDIWVLSQGFTPEDKVSKLGSINERSWGWRLWAPCAGHTTGTLGPWEETSWVLAHLRFMKSNTQVLGPGENADKQNTIKFQCVRKICSLRALSISWTGLQIVKWVTGVTLWDMAKETKKGKEGFSEMYHHWLPFVTVLDVTFAGGMLEEPVTKSSWFHARESLPCFLLRWWSK